MAAQLDLDIITTHNPKTLGVVDISLYDVGQNISAPTLEVTPPGFNKVAFPFEPGKVNIINSNNVKLTSTLNASELVNLPDGIWIFRYSIQPALKNFVQRKYFRTDNIQYKFYQIFLSVDSECNDNDYCLTSKSKKDQEKKLMDIKLMINGSIAAANRGDDSIAMQMYKRADSLIDRFNICKDC